MKLLRWILMNAALVFCLYFGFIGGIDGYRRIAVAYIWIYIACNFTSQSVLKNILEDANFVKGKKRSVPNWMNTYFDGGVCTFLFYFDWPITASFFMVAILLNWHFWQKVEEKQKEIQAAP